MKKSNFKKIRKVIVDVIFLASTWFGLTAFIFIIYFIVNILLISSSCTEVVNGVCQVGVAADKRLVNGSLVIFIAAAPLTYLIYKKAHRLFYVIAILSFLFGLTILILK
jgi:hypothetical protein